MMFLRLFSRQLRNVFTGTTFIKCFNSFLWNKSYKKKPSSYVNSLNRFWFASNNISKKYFRWNQIAFSLRWRTEKSIFFEIVYLCFITAAFLVSITSICQENFQNMFYSCVTTCLEKDGAVNQTTFYVNFLTSFFRRFSICLF